MQSQQQSTVNAFQTKELVYFPQEVNEVPEFLVKGMQRISGMMVQGKSADDRNYSNSIYIVFNHSDGFIDGGKHFSLRLPDQEFFRDQKFNNVFYEFYIGRLAHKQHFTVGDQDVEFEYILRLWLPSTYYLLRKSLQSLVVPFLEWAVGHSLVYRKLKTGRPLPPTMRRTNTLQYINSMFLYVDISQAHQAFEVEPSLQIKCSAEYQTLLTKFGNDFKIVANQMIIQPREFLHIPSISLALKDSQLRLTVAANNYPSSLLRQFYSDVYMVCRAQFAKFQPDPKQGEAFDQLMMDLNEAAYQDNFILKYVVGVDGKLNDTVSSFGYLKFFQANNVHVHPSFNAWFKLNQNISLIQQYAAQDLLVFDTIYIAQVLLFSFWVRKVLLPNKDKVKNSQSVLLLFGDSGAGKSQLVQCLQQIANGFRWKLNQQFYNPAVLDAQFLILEDIKLEDLVKNSDNKNLLDFENPTVVDIKFAQPLTLTKHCPVIITTNDSLYRLTTSKLAQDHINAFKRRVFPVSFEHGKYLEMHELQQGFERYHDRIQGINQFSMVNAIIGMALCFSDSDDLGRVDFDEGMGDYYTHVVNSFARTAFGRIVGKFLPFIQKALTTYLRSVQDETVTQQKLQSQVTAISQILNQIIMKEQMRYQADFISESFKSYITNQQALDIILEGDNRQASADILSGIKDNVFLHQFFSQGFDLEMQPHMSQSQRDNSFDSIFQVQLDVQAPVSFVQEMSQCRKRPRTFSNEEEIELREQVVETVVSDAIQRENRRIRVDRRDGVEVQYEEEKEVRPQQYDKTMATHGTIDNLIDDFEQYAEELCAQHHQEFSHDLIKEGEFRSQSTCRGKHSRSASLDQDDSGNGDAEDV